MALKKKNFGLSVLAILGVITLVSGCAAPGTLSISPSNPVGPQLQQHGLTLRCIHGNEVIVRLLNTHFGSESDQLPGFAITVENRSRLLFYFGPKHISVYLGTRPVRTYTRAELQHKIRTEFDRLHSRVSNDVTVSSSIDQSTNEGPGAARRAYNRARTFTTGIANWESHSLHATYNLLSSGMVDPGESISGVVKLHAGTLIEPGYCAWLFA